MLALATALHNRRRFRPRGPAAGATALAMRARTTCSMPTEVTALGERLRLSAQTLLSKPEAEECR